MSRMRCESIYALVRPRFGTRFGVNCMEFEHSFFSAQATSFLLSACESFSIGKIPAFVLLLLKFIYLFVLNLNIYSGMLSRLQFNFLATLKAVLHTFPFCVSLQSDFVSFCQVEFNTSPRWSIRLDGNLMPETSSFDAVRRMSKQMWFQTLS